MYPWSFIAIPTLPLSLSAHRSAVRDKRGLKKLQGEGVHSEGTPDQGIFSSAFGETVITATFPGAIATNQNLVPVKLMLF